MLSLFSVVSFYIFISLVIVLLLLCFTKLFCYVHLSINPSSHMYGWNNFILKVYHVWYCDIFENIFMASVNFISFPETVIFNGLLILVTRVHTSNEIQNSSSHCRFLTSWNYWWNLCKQMGHWNVICEKLIFYI